MKEDFYLQRAQVERIEVDYLVHPWLSRRHN